MLKFIPTLALISLTTLSTAAWAADPGLAPAIAKIAHDSLAYNQTQNYVPVPEPTHGELTANSGKLAAAYNSTHQLRSKSMLNAVSDMLNNRPSQLHTINPASSTTRSQDYFNSLVASDIPKVCLSSFTDDPNLIANPQLGNANFNVNSLIGTSVYNQQQQTYAQNYIAFLSNQAKYFIRSVPPKLSSDDCTSYKTQSSDYRLAFRNWTSTTSLALDTMYQSYLEREPDDNLSKSLAIPKSDTPNNDGKVSPLFAEKYLTERRLQPAYQATMQKMPPATVNREMLNVLSQISYQLYQRQQAQERTNLLLSALLLQTSNSDIARKMISMKSQTNSK